MDVKLMMMSNKICNYAKNSSGVDMGFTIKSIGLSV